MFTRALKRLIAKIGIAAVLFTQLAVAAYACPILVGADNSTPVAMAETMDAGMPGCEQVDTDNPNLCLQHCQADSQSVQTTPQVSIPPVVMMPIAIIEPVQLVTSLGTTRLPTFLERETSPPRLIRFGVLRI